MLKRLSTNAGSDDLISVYTDVNESNTFILGYLSAFCMARSSFITLLSSTTYKFLLLLLGAMGERT
jgi:hypothetical protein